MISGKLWSDSDFLKQAFEDCKKWAKEDCEFFESTLEQSTRNCLKRKIKEWTWVKEEQESILNEIMEGELL